MKYMGSKNRLAKYILPIILKNRKKDQYFYDLMCGGGNICDKIPHPVVANDSDYYTISALKMIRDSIDKIPKNNTEFTEDHYNEFKQFVKLCKEHNDEKKLSHSIGLIGYAGFTYSYSGKFFGGWARGNASNGSPRDYVAESYRNAVKQSPNLQHVTLTNYDYWEIPLYPNSIIYLDPPYKNSTKYRKKDFDYDFFYNWCVEKSNEGHEVYISEYQMPDDRFECIWEKEVNNSLTKNTGGKKGVEKLFSVKK